jgi:hypothetical protein
MSETVQNLVQAIKAGDALETENAFNANAMAEKLSTRLDTMRQDVAQGMFAQATEQEAEPVTEPTVEEVMRYYEFTKSLKRSDIVESIRSYLQLIERTEDDKILINGIETEFTSLEEARQYIKQDYISQQLEEQVSKDLYEELSEHTVANIIKEYHDIKVTDTLIENYIKLASSHMFSVDPVVQGIRSLNKLDRLVEGKLHYVLNDESIVTIDERTQMRLNNLLHNQTEIIEYMRESKENFMHVLTKLEEQ